MYFVSIQFSIMKVVFFCISIIISAHSYSQETPDYDFQFDFFGLSLGFQDSAAVREYFESDSAYQSNVWNIFEPEFVKAIATYNYSDMTDSYIAGVPVKQLIVTYPYSGEDMEGNEFSGTTTIYVFFKEEPNHLIMYDYFRPEGTDAP